MAAENQSFDPFSSIANVAASLARGEISSLELADAMNARIANSADDIGSYSDVLYRTASMEAIGSDVRRAAGNVLGPLDGVPIAVKDLIDTPPARCSGGLATRRSNRPAVAASVVRALRNAGAVILGVTHTDPGAFSTETPQVFNPLDRNRTAGGSSGGSAAAVSAGLAFGAIGTDTGGSIRIPAACCGVFGFKPTWGRVDASGVMPLAHSLDHVGPIARSMADIHILQNVLDPDLSSTELADRRDPPVIGVPRGYFQDADPVILAAVSLVEEQCRDIGCSIVDVELPEPDFVSGIHMTILPREAADYHQRAHRDDLVFYPEVARRTIEIGNAVSDNDLAEAIKLRSVARAAVDLCFDDVSALLLPVMPIDTPLRDAAEFTIGGSVLSKLQATVWYTSLFNHTGHPAIALPSRHQVGCRPIPVQLVGPRNSDKDLLDLASTIG